MTSSEPSSIQNDLKNNETPFHESLKSSVKSALVEKFIKGDERPCNEDDFLETKQIREKITSEICIKLKNYLITCTSKSNHAAFENELLPLLLLLCGQNTCLHPWNTEATVNNCEDILLQITKFFQCNDTSDFLSKILKTTLIKSLLQILCPELTVTTWKHFPASIASFEWILKKIKQPDLSQHLQFLLPPSLLLTDDYVNENKIIGTKCLHHIIENIVIAELQFYGHGNVIYSALMPLLRIREADLINCVIPPLLSLTTKLEFDLGNKDLTKWSKFDEILEIYLENMEMEQLISLRDCYINNLGPIVSATGFRIFRWSKRLLRIFQEYITTAKTYSDEKTLNTCLKVVEKYIEITSQLSFLYAENLLATLMHALHFTKDSNTVIQNESKDITIRCVAILLKCIPEPERGQLVKIIQEKFSFCVLIEG